MVRAGSYVGWTYSVQQINLLLQLPDEVVFVLVGLQQPDVLLTLSGQLLNTHGEDKHTPHENGTSAVHRASVAELFEALDSTWKRSTWGEGQFKTDT